jgi:FAD binding domain
MSRTVLIDAQLRCDGHHEMLDFSGKPAQVSEMGEPIPGLFVCGNDKASIMRGHYPGPGITLGPALVFAYRAAMAIKGDRVGQ